MATVPQPPITIGGFDNVPAPRSLIASDWAQDVTAHVVHPFADDADRATKWVTPPDGSLSTLGASGVIEVYRAGAWHSLADTGAVTGGLDLKVDKVTVTADGDIFTRAGGVPARITRPELALDPAFVAAYGAAGVTPPAPLFVGQTWVNSQDGGLFWWTGFEWAQVQA